jgi:hypothetical protein
LLEIVAAQRATSGFAGALHGRQQQADEDRDDRDYDEQFDETERGAAAPGETQRGVHARRSNLGPEGAFGRSAPLCSWPTLSGFGAGSMQQSVGNRGGDRVGMQLAAETVVNSIASRDAITLTAACEKHVSGG